MNTVPARSAEFIKFAQCPREVHTGPIEPKHCIHRIVPCPGEAIQSIRHFEIAAGGEDRKPLLREGQFFHCCLQTDLRNRQLFLRRRQGHKGFPDVQHDLVADDPHANGFLVDLTPRLADSAFARAVEEGNREEQPDVIRIQRIVPAGSSSAPIVWT